MRHDSIGSGKRKPVNLTLDTGVVEAARAVGLNLSQVCEAGLAAEVKKEQIRRWQAEHSAAIEANNAWVEEHGLPLAEYRMF
jgi:antitoxin CcdA